MRGYAEFERVAREQQQRGGCVFVYFSGDKDPDTGISWCPDCVKGGWRGQACFSAGWRHVHVGIGLSRMPNPILRPRLVAAGTAVQVLRQRGLSKQAPESFVVGRGSVGRPFAHQAINRS